MFKKGCLHFALQTRQPYKADYNIITFTFNLYIGYMFHIYDLIKHMIYFIYDSLLIKRIV